MATICEQLTSVKNCVEESLQVGILIASIDVAEMRLVVAAFETLDVEDVKWDSVLDRLIKEWRAVMKSPESGKSSTTGRVKCDFCERLGYTAERCWTSLLNLDRSLKDLKKESDDHRDKRDPHEDPKSKNQKAKSKPCKKTSEFRAAMYVTGKRKLWSMTS